jgi:hypothetical protein
MGNKEEMARRATRDLMGRSDKSNRYLQEFLVPLYLPNERDKLQLLGSGILLRIAGRQFLITAAHVLDDASPERPIYIPNEERGDSPLQGIPCVTAIPEGGERRHDRLDIGVVEMHNATIGNLPGYEFLTVADIGMSERPVEGCTYSLMGFPYTKNKPPYCTNHVRPTLVTYTTTSADESLYQSMGSATDTSLLLHLKREDTMLAYGNRGKAPATAPHPKGMSGGAVWRLEGVARQAGCNSVNKLVGVFIEYHKDHHVVVATKVDVVVDLIRHCWPELSDSLPSPKCSGPPPTS